MTGLSNLHTHTVYCDGQNTPEELVLAAIEKGCASIGFSGHSYTFFDTSYCMSQENTKKYIGDIRRLQNVYADKITILLGIEQDYFSKEHTAPYQFIIGSVHYVFKDGAYIPVDESEAITREIVARYYGGDYYKFVRDYYALVADVHKKTKAGIVGHFDLVTKFNRENRLFSEEDPRYKTAALEALKALAEAGAVLEVNTGAMYRGYLDRPYPSPFLLKAAKEFGCQVILSSDSHDIPSLCFAFPEMLELLKHCGFFSVLVWQGSHLIQQKI